MSIWWQWNWDSSWSDLVSWGSLFNLHLSGIIHVSKTYLSNLKRTRHDWASAIIWVVAVYFPAFFTLFSSGDLASNFPPFLSFTWQPSFTALYHTAVVLSPILIGITSTSSSLHLDWKAYNIVWNFIYRLLSDWSDAVWLHRGCSATYPHVLSGVVAFSHRVILCSVVLVRFQKEHQTHRT